MVRRRADDLFGRAWRLERYRVLSEDAGAAEVSVTRGPTTVRRLEQAVGSAALAEIAARVAFGPGSRTEALEEWRRRRLEKMLAVALAASKAPRRAAEQVLTGYSVRGGYGSFNRVVRSHG